MAVAIVPAAGRSHRMGRPKLLLPFGETTILGCAVRALREGGASKIVVVTRRDDESLAAWVRDNGLLAAVNPEPERGMLSSIWAGLAALGGDEALAAAETPLLVSPGDLPLLRSETVRAVLEALGAKKARLVVPAYESRRGHPLAIAPRLIPEIPRLDPGVGLRQLLELHAADVVELAVGDPGVVREINTPADYEALTGGSPE